MKLMQKKQQPARRSGNSSIRQTRATGAELNARYSFRRNRTLTGSLSSGVSSVNEHHSELRSIRVQMHKLRHHRRRLFSILLGILLITAGLAYLLHQSIAIPHVVATTSVPIDATQYERTIQNYLYAHPAERFRFAMNTAAVTTYLQLNGFPEVESVSPNLGFDGLGRARIDIAMRRPAVAWSTAGQDLYVDDVGNAFMRNYYTESTVRVVDKTGIQTKDNQVLASNRFLSFIGRLIGKMKTSGYKVTQVALPADTTRQVEVSIEGMSSPIKFSVDREVSGQVEDASRSIKYLTSKGITVEYIDVRVSGKAFYK